MSPCGSPDLQQPSCSFVDVYMNVLLCMFMYGVNQLKGWSRKVGLLGHGRGRPLLSSVHRRQPSPMLRR